MSSSPATAPTSSESNKNSSSSTPPSSPPPEKSPPPPEKSSSPPTPDTSNNNKSSPPKPDTSNSNKSSPSPPTQNNSNTPSPKAVSSPPKSKSSSPSPPALSSDRKSSDNDDQIRAIVGGVLGVGSVLLILIIVCVVCMRRRKKRKQMYYYEATSMRKGSGYYNSGQHHNWNAGADHVVRVNQSPSGMGPNGGAWVVPTLPQMNSTDMSSNYSLGPPPLPPPSPSLALGLTGGTFTYEELASATDGFADKNLLGQGGFGYVHKGVLPNGKEVAVKSLKAGSGQGEREFQAEIDIISRVHHRHLVSLVGYCIAGGQRMLVYEFVPNDNLEHHLHGKGVPTMDWSSRLRIAVGSAKGLAYLHEDCHPRIIHRDIKAANVLLDDSFEAKVADFGLAKLTTDNNTHVSTRVMGTFGYLAPEYASSGKLTEKSDVFSFGVMLLELITGKRPVDILNAMDDSLVDWARPLLTRGLEDGHFEELVDPFLEGNYNNQEMARMSACAAASIRHSAKKRPKMSQIVRGLEGDVSLDDLNEGTKPGHANIFASSSGSSDYDTSAKSRQITLSSQEFGSSVGSSGEMTHHRDNIPREHH